MLPPPKNPSDSATGFTPYILTKKKGSVVETKKVQSLSEKDCSSSSLMLQHTELSEYEANDDAAGKDFFSLENVTKKENSIQDFPCEELSYSTAIPASNEFGQNYSGEFPATFLKCTNAENKVDFDSLSYGITDCNAVTLGSEELRTTASETIVQGSLLNDEGFLKLQGRRQEMESISIIDVKADDQLVDRNEWLMKSLTEERDLRPSKRKHDLPT
ncbi:Proline-rich protein PRCC, partial [Stegodyphus mimosarum]